MSPHPPKMRALNIRKPDFSEIQKILKESIVDSSTKLPIQSRLTLDSLVQKIFKDGRGEIQKSFEIVLSNQSEMLEHMVMGRVHGKDVEGLYVAANYDKHEATPASLLKEISDPQYLHGAIHKAYATLGIGKAQISEMTRELEGIAKIFVESHYSQFAGPRK